MCDLAFELKSGTKQSQGVFFPFALKKIPSVSVVSGHGAFVNVSLGFSSGLQINDG